MTRPIPAELLQPASPSGGSSAGQSSTTFGPWTIWFDPPPVPHCDWHYAHEDAEEDGPYWMRGTCTTRDDCFDAIILHYEERGS